MIQRVRSYLSSPTQSTKEGNTLARALCLKWQSYFASVCGLKVRQRVCVYHSGGDLALGCFNQIQIRVLLRLRHTLYCSPCLNQTCYGLKQSKKNREYQNQKGHPEGVPLDLLTIIIPPRRDIVWLRIIKGLL